MMQKHWIIYKVGKIDKRRPEVVPLGEAWEITDQSHQAAVLKAQQMAQEHPGAMFAVCEISKVYKTDVPQVILEELDDNIPAPVEDEELDIPNFDNGQEPPVHWRVDDLAP